MNAGEVIAKFRRRVDDVVEDFSWTPEEVMGYLVEAQREAAERALLLEDDTTTAVCHIAGLANTAKYALHEKIIEVRSVLWDDRYLEGTSVDQLVDQYRTGWKDLTGRPSKFIDPQQGYITLFRKPTEAADIDLNVYRYPLIDPVAPGSALEIHPKHHEGLVDWMEHLAYLKPDTETFDVAQSDKAAARFTAKFGVKIDANARRTQRARTRNQVVMNPGW